MGSKEIEIANYLKLLTDISSIDVDDLTLFQGFHELVVKVGYNALEVQFDYKRKRVTLYVVPPELMNDTIIPCDTMALVPVNLCYDDLSEFLDSCIGKDTKNLLVHKKLFFESFFEGKSKLKGYKRQTILG